MKKAVLTLGAVLLIFLILFFVLRGSLKREEVKEEKNESQKSSLIFFYGETCPHCKETEKWLKENKIEEKVKIVKKEVYRDQNNAQELASVAKNCDLDTSLIGVPFLYDGEKCYIGTPEIIDFLSKKVGL